MPFVRDSHMVFQPECNSPEHNPPSMLVLKPGQHVWRCPACGNEAVVNVPGMRMHERLRNSNDNFRVQGDHTIL